MRKSKSCEAYEKLKKEFAEDAIEKDKLLTVSDLSALLGLGRAPVLEAIKRLNTEGFLTIIPQKGIMVKELTLTEMREINDTRKALECFAIEAIAPSFQAEDVFELNVLMERMRLAEKKNDPRAFLDGDVLFHQKLCQCAANSLINEIMERLQARIYAAGLFLIKQPGRMTTTLIEHRAICDALERNDPETARAAMLEHLENAQKLMM